MSRRHPFYATLASSSPRFADWLRVYGGATVPIKSPAVMTAALPIGMRQVYLVALDALERDAYERLVSHLAEKFGEPSDVVRKALADEGLPILAEDIVAITIERRFVS